MIKGRLTAGIDGGVVAPALLSVSCSGGTAYAPMVGKDVFVVEASVDGVVDALGNLTVVQVLEVVSRIREQMRIAE